MDLRSNVDLLCLLYNKNTKAKDPKVLQFRPKQSQTQWSCTKGNFPMTMNCARLQFLFSFLKHHKLMELKATVWKQSLQSTYRWRAILWTWAMKLGIILMFLKSYFHANRKGCVREWRVSTSGFVWTSSGMTNIQGVGKCPRTLKKFQYYKGNQICCD